jgi:hypothetical protein
VGIRTALKLIETAPAATLSRSAGTSIISPWQVGGPSKMVLADIFGAQAEHITRAEAMTLPPVVKGRAILAGQLAPVPLVALDENGPLGVQPEWLQRTDGVLSPWHRMLWTIDDLMFVGWSLWGVLRDSDGAITTADRIPVEWWTIDADGTVLIDDGSGPAPVDAADVILIPGPSEGLLEFATRSIRGAVLLVESWVKRSKSPIPLVELHETIDGGLEEGEAEALVQDFITAREDKNGMVSFTPYAIELRAHGETSPQLAIEGRNFVKVDIANFLNLPAAALDGSLSTASLTYSTQEGSRNEIADYALAYWSDPIAARFSQDDVTPAGSRIRFDFAQIRTTAPAPTGPNVKD